MNRSCIYFCEGECEEALIKALKEYPELIMPGKTRVFNVISKAYSKIGTAIRQARDDRGLCF